MTVRPSILISFFLYGAYVILLGLCISFLLRRKGPRIFAHLFFTVLLFILATIGILLQTLLTVSEANIALRLSLKTPPLNALGTGALVVLIISNVVADTLMIWRCYLVWSSRIKFVVLPAILCILNNVAALVIVLVSTKHSFDPTISGPLSELSSAVPPTVLTAFLYGALASNTVLTSMIAGRIYYVIRNDLTLLGPRARRTYKTAIAVSIESGILYPVALAVEAAILPAIHRADPANKIHYQLLAIFGKTMYLLLVQIVGIAPTLIIIRIGLGSCVVDAKYGGSESQSDGRIEDGSSTTNRDCTASSVSLRFRKPDDSEVHVIPSDASTE